MAAVLVLIILCHGSLNASRLGHDTANILANVIPKAIFFRVEKMTSCYYEEIKPCQYN